MKNLLLIFIFCIFPALAFAGGTSGSGTGTSLTNGGGGGTANVSITAGSANITLSPSTITGTGTIDLGTSPTLGAGALAATATTGYPYIATVAGVPTGIPTTKSGYVGTVYDTTDNRLYIYNSGWSNLGTSLSSLVAATTTNSINNAGLAQTWTWNSLGTATALSISTSQSSGISLSVTATSNASNTGYAGLFTNTATTGFALGTNGVFSATENNSNFNAPVGIFTNTAAQIFLEIMRVLAPNNTTAGNLTYMTFGIDVSTKNVADIGFQYESSGSNNNSLVINLNGGGNTCIYGNGHTLITSAGTCPSTATADQLDIAGGIGMTTTTATVPTNGIYSPSANSITFTSNGVAALNFDNNQHWVGSGGSAPACGTGCTSILSGSTDVRGQFTTSTSITSSSITFAHAFASVPFCTITDNSTAAVTDLSATTTAALTVSFASSITSAAVNYICIQ